MVASFVSQDVHRSFLGFFSVPLAFFCEHIQMHIDVLGEKKVSSAVTDEGSWQCPRLHWPGAV